MRRRFLRVIPLLPVLTIALYAASQDVPGVHNFHQVNDHVYRGGQPLPAGFQSLAKMGIRTVVDLRGEGQARLEQKLVEDAGMHYVHVPMAGLSAPKDEQIKTLLNLLDDPTAWPIFVHCRRGADRTGTVIACYRIRHDHWQNEKALQEARMNGMSRIERAMMQFVRQFDASKFTAPLPGSAANAPPPAPVSP